MLKKIIYRLLERRHYWRHVSFSEVAELYISRTLRMLAVSLVNIFVAVYLYQNGYRLTFIMLYFAAYFAIKAALTIPFAYLIAAIGPKHAALFSNLAYVPALLILALLPGYGLGALAGFALFQAISVGLYDVSYLVNFSKVRVSEHTGKELGYMYILERLAAGLSPVIGGLTAFWLGPQAALIIASVVFAAAALPLLSTPEPVTRHQKITYRGVPWRRIVPNLRAEIGVGFDFIMSGTGWSLFLALAVFSETSNAVYAKLGLLTSVTVIVSIAAATIYGRIIDRRSGRPLLMVSTSLDALTHLMRPMISTPVGAVLTNILNEIATTGYTMPFTKGLFDAADRLPGYRIVYMSLMSLAATAGALLCVLSVALLSVWLPEVLSLQIGFVITAAAAILITGNGFPALARTK